METQQTQAHEINSLINEISSYHDYNIDKTTIDRIEKLLLIVNDNFDEDYDFIVTQDYWYWGIKDDENLNFNIAHYYNLEAKKHFQRNEYYKALFFLHLAEFYVIKEDVNSEAYQYNLLVTGCNKCFTLFFLNETQKALAGFQALSVSASYFTMTFEQTMENSTCRSSLQLGEILCQTELGELQAAERLTNMIVINLAEDSYKKYYDRLFVLKTLMAKICLKRQDKSTVFNIITDAITEGFYYRSNYSNNLREDIECFLNRKKFESIDFEDIIDMMLEIHIKRDIADSRYGKDLLFI